MSDSDPINDIANNGQRKVTKCLKRYMRERGPNALMPSFRDLSRLCRVSPLTVSDVVSRFAEYGLLVVKPRRGIYTPEKIAPEISSPEKLQRVDVVLVETKGMQHDPQEFHRDMVYELGNRPALLDMEVRLHHVPAGPDTAQRLKKITHDKDCQGVLVSRLASLDQLAVFEDALIPYICIYPESRELPPDRSVLVDIEALVAGQVNHLTEPGHTRIGYLHNVTPNVFHHSHLLRRETFFRLALDRRLDVDSSIVLYAGFDPAQQAQAVRKMLDSPRRPTAIICNDEHLPAVYRVATEKGLTIGRDLCVVGTNNTSVSQSLTPAATTMEIPRGGAVQLALDMLQEAYARGDGKVRNRFVDTKLIVRGSTAGA